MNNISTSVKISSNEFEAILRGNKRFVVINKPVAIGSQIECKEDDPRARSIVAWASHNQRLAKDTVIVGLSDKPVI